MSKADEAVGPKSFPAVAEKPVLELVCVRWPPQLRMPEAPAVVTMHVTVSTPLSVAAVCALGSVAVTRAVSPINPVVPTRTLTMGCEVQAAVFDMLSVHRNTVPTRTSCVGTVMLEHIM